MKQASKLLDQGVQRVRSRCTFYVRSSFSFLSITVPFQPCQAIASICQPINRSITIIRRHRCYRVSNSARLKRTSCSNAKQSIPTSRRGKSSSKQDCKTFAGVDSGKIDSQNRRDKFELNRSVGDPQFRITRLIYFRFRIIDFDVGGDAIGLFRAIVCVCVCVLVERG